MRAISLFALLLLMAETVWASSSIYGSAFDYKKAQPSEVYFPGKSRQEIAAYCKQQALGTMDLSACAQFEYEGAEESLNSKILEIEGVIARTDHGRRANNEPQALPFFKQAQSHWELYRDNACYCATYEAGQASLHFVYFWDCMASITRRRLEALSRPDREE